MQTKLVEFKNQENEILRGIMTLPDGRPESGTIFLQGFEGGMAAKTRAVSLSAAGAAR